MAHTPLRMSIPEVQDEVRQAWMDSYSPAATARAIESIAQEPVPYKISHFVARIFFRGIYFPPQGAWGWLKVIAQNRGSIYRIIRESFSNWSGSRADGVPLEFEAGAQRQTDFGDA